MSTPYDQPGTEVEVSSDERSEDSAPSTTPNVDRSAAFSDTSPAVPRVFIYWVLAAAAILGLGGLVLEHIFSSSGLNPVPTAQTKTTVSTIPVTTPTPIAPNQQVQLSASLSAFMDLNRLRATPAPSFNLIDQSGQLYSLASQAQKVVVLTFFSGACDDICPVLAAEIRQANTDLGTASGKVEFVTVNTDPKALSVAGLSNAVAQSGLGSLPNWRMLTGPLATVNAVWKSYGITITVTRHSGLDAHNDLIYFIDPLGRERYEATPFANESLQGDYSLSAAAISRWGAGIATYANKLATS